MTHTPTEAEVEAAARAIANVHGQDPDDFAPLSKMTTADNYAVQWWMVFEEEARASLTAAYALRDEARGSNVAAPEGWKLVPIEPTEAMQKASAIVTRIAPGVARITTWGANVWGAMLNAAPAPPASSPTAEPEEKGL